MRLLLYNIRYATGTGAAFHLPVPGAGYLRSNPRVLEGITRFISENFRQRDLQAYGHQHQFNALRLTRKSTQIQVDAYCMIYRHEFHRRYWPSGPSWRMGTWHALCRYVDDGWRIADLDIRMWTDTAFGTTGTRLAPQRQPGMPGTRE